MAAVLPSVLRPPPDESTQSAALSPDAPPDEEPEAIIQSLQQAASRTAGASGQAPIVDEGPAPPPPPPPPPPEKAPTKAQCFGDPPRQVESLYAAPCQPAFVGDNGGETYHGVTRDEIRIAIIVCSGTLQTTYDGLVPHEPPATDAEDSRDRTYRVLQAYFNANFEFHARRLQLVSVRPDTDRTSGPLCDQASFRRAVIEADTEYGPIFGVVSENPGAQLEAVERRMVTGGLYGALDFYEENHPYVHAWAMDAGKLIKFGNEFICKQVWGRPASFTDDPTIQGRERKLGLVLFEGDVHDIPVEVIQDDLDVRCGARFEQVVRMNLYDNERNQTLATAIAQMKANGITTISLGLDYLTAGILTHQATQQQYFPEWLVCGCGEIDRNELVQLFFDQVQWSHAFGVSPNEIARPQQATEWWRAYKTIDPERNPNESTGKYLWNHVLQYMNGLQMAGPEVTPENFLEGLWKIPHRKPDPKWSVGGGYGPGDYTYGDYVSLVWWNPTEPAADEAGQPGAYMHLMGGQRFAVGEIPTEPLGWFDDGISTPPPDEL